MSLNREKEDVKRERGKKTGRILFLLFIQNFYQTRKIMRGGTKNGVAFHRVIIIQFFISDLKGEYLNIYLNYKYEDYSSIEL